MSRRRTRADTKHLPRWQAWSLHVAFGLLLASGVLWLVFHYGVTVQTEFGPRPHWLEYQWLRLHGLAAMLALAVFGSLMPVHIRKAWELRRNRASGLAVTLVFVVLTISGYLLYYFATEQSRVWIGTLHWGLGLAGVPALGWHMLERRRRQRTQPAARSAAPEFTSVDVRVP